MVNVCASLAAYPSQKCLVISHQMGQREFDDMRLMFAAWEGLPEMTSDGDNTRPATAATARRDDSGDDYSAPTRPPLKQGERTRACAPGHVMVGRKAMRLYDDPAKLAKYLRQLPDEVCATDNAMASVPHFGGYPALYEETNTPTLLGLPDGVSLWNRRR